MWASFWLGVVAYAVAWTWGGRVERFAAAVLLVQCVIMTINFILTWESGGVYLTGKIANVVVLLITGWLCIRSDRWWLLLMTATTGLKTLADLVGVLDPGLSDFALASAKIGLGYVIDLTLMLSVVERWLAGEAPAGRTAWARADIATAARRNRRPHRRSRRVPASSGNNEPTVHGPDPRLPA